MKKLNIDHHFFAAYNAGSTTLQILEILPDCDYVEEIRNIMVFQHEIFNHILDGKHYGTNSLDEFLSYMEELREEITRLRFKN